MKKFFSLMLLLVVVVSVLSACGNGKKRKCDAYGSTRTIELESTKA